jgi:hypothetical protein
MLLCEIRDEQSSMGAVIYRPTRQPYSENNELGGSDRFEGDPIAQPLNAPRELVDEMGLSTVINVMGPQLPIGFAAKEPIRH